MSVEPGTRPTRRGRPGYDRETVVRHAVEVFNRRGYDATSMDDVARELGLSKSTIYHHVPTKEHLLRAALEEGLGALEQLLDTAEDRAGGAGERLRWTVGRSVEVLAAHLPAVRLVLRVRGNSDAEQEALERRRGIDARLTRLVAAAVAEGSVRADVAPEVASRLVFGMVNSLTEWYDPAGGTDPAAMGRIVADAAWEGLAER
ncbi:TetR/AcrR family transcriptional regulator [Nocardioides sp. HDW12B]|uniref:TetR/AcrR family transcriptional regulator n=1 Tax=Nocardioides sp. HDW12B TaxID=2714939 RepID=UPI001408C77D|nr:TetR/AcrR family transcriptional regulator [Nocardioides sp. HDW12B]QIK66580.1 TetR/AcrR family transcriptional regulator [Nocardioides sp. HDW12B]